MRGRQALAAAGRLALVLLVAVPAAGQPAAPPPPDEHAGHHPGAAVEMTPERKYFTDVVLIDQDGKPMRFYSDLLEGRKVLINAFFTTCDGVCPVMTQKLAEVQSWLGDRLGSEVLMLSISVDPETDTPQRLKEYAERFHARPGWYFLGGEKENVDWALYRVGQYVEQKEAHTNLVIVGDEPGRTWSKVFGLAPTRQLIQAVEGVLDGSAAP